MYPTLLVRKYNNKIIAKIARELIHRANPSDYFSKFIEKQNNPFKEATYVLTFDFDFESDIKAFPFLLEKLKEYDVKAGFAVIGKFVEKYPEIHRRAVEEGHEIINHTYTHPDNPHFAPDRFFNKLSYDEQKYEIEKANETFKEILGVDCIGFRTPHYGNLHTESVYPILESLGYKYSSSTASCRVDGYSAPYMHSHGIMEISTGCSKNFPMAIFDSWNMLRKKNPFIGDDEKFSDEFDLTMEVIAEKKAFLTHYFDPYDIINNEKLDRVLKGIKKYDIKTKLYRDLF